MENNYKVILETDEGTQTLTTPEEKSEAVADLVKAAAHLYRNDAAGSLDMLVSAKGIINNMLRGLHGREELENRDLDNRAARIIKDESNEDTGKLHILEAVQAAGTTGITLTAENIGNYDFSGLEFAPADAKKDAIIRKIAESLLEAVVPEDADSSEEAELECDICCGGYNGGVYNCNVHVKKLKSGDFVTSIIDNTEE